MSVDIAGVGFGPAMAGFLYTLSRNLLKEDGSPRFESCVADGMPLQVICYERADGLGFGVSGAVTKARGIRASFPETDLSQIPMAVPVGSEKLVYLLDPVGASRRSWGIRIIDRLIKTFGGLLGVRDSAVEAPFIPSFMNKHGGMIFSLGQFNQWVSDHITSTGTVQIWPGMPVSEPLFKGDQVNGIRLVDQGLTLDGKRGEGFMLGMDVHAGLTVVADGPIGAVGQELDRHFGLPRGHAHSEWALGMKMVIELHEDCELEAGTVLHTFGFPEPEIFGFVYVHPERLASVGIFIPSWFRSPARTAYRYLQHFMQHPYLWRHLQGGTLKSWGAKSLQESGRHGEPFLAGDGYVRIGEGSGSTNVLAGSGVDEAWTTGVQLGEAVLELLEQKKAFTRKNLERSYVRRRRESWVERESKIAASSRNGFQYGVLRGIIGMGLAGFSHGVITFPTRKRQARLSSLGERCAGRISPEELQQIQKDCASSGAAVHDRVMDRLGWPEIQCDGKLLISHQDTLLMGGSVQAPPGYANHVVFTRTAVCKDCEPKLCVEMCSGQAITRDGNRVPAFDREKCVYCGACLWNCPSGNVEFKAGAGGLHSTMN